MMTWEILTTESGELHVRRKFDPAIPPVGRIQTYSTLNNVPVFAHGRLSSGQIKGRVLVETFDVVAMIMPHYKKILRPDKRNPSGFEAEIEVVPNKLLAEAILKSLTERPEMT